MITLFAMLGAAFIVALGCMLIAWVIYFVQKKANIVDVAWAVAFLGVAWAYFFIGDGYAPKRWMITMMGTLWAIRLGKHLLERLFLFPEDNRYTEMRLRWGGDPTHILFLMMFLLQGSLVVILSLPFLVVAYGAAPGWTGSELLGILLWALGLSGEALADFQLARFRSEPDQRGKVMDKGLWRFSRHPNYFFEWVLWIGFFLFALSSPGGLVAVLSPIIMFGLLTQGSGIPLNEKQALISKGEAYRRYQQTTSAFVPWLPKSEKTLLEDHSDKGATNSSKSEPD